MRTWISFCALCVGLWACQSAPTESTPPPANTQKKMTPLSEVLPKDSNSLLVPAPASTIDEAPPEPEALLQDVETRFAPPPPPPVPEAPSTNSTPPPPPPEAGPEIMPMPVTPKAPTVTDMAPQVASAKTSQQIPPLSHNAWHKLLQKYVSSTGQVDYAGFKQSRAKLADYLMLLQTHPPQRWPKAKEMAYWINLYNAATVLLIIDHYPLQSITQLDNGNTWSIKRIKVGNKTYALDEIEKQKLLKRFGDPRVHFAVNCAARSCPPLLNKAYTAANLEAQLEAQTRAFINNSMYNQLQKRKVTISKIFDWYAEDFGNDVVAYLQRYAQTSINDNAKVQFNTYDWKLNKK